MSRNKPIYEYNDKGNLIHRKDSDGYEQWYEYDSNGNQIYFKDTNGYEYWYEYDANGKEIHYKDNKGYERWYWEGKITLDPVKILLLSTQLYSEVSQ